MNIFHLKAYITKNEVIYSYTWTPLARNIGINDKMTKCPPVLMTDRIVVTGEVARIRPNWQAFFVICAARLGENAVKIGDNNTVS